MIFGWPYRWPPTFAVPAFYCFARSSHRKPGSFTEAFSFFAVPKPQLHLAALSVFSGLAVLQVAPPD
jgi:hypothetical protein